MMIGQLGWEKIDLTVVSNIWQLCLLARHFSQWKTGLKKMKTLQVRTPVGMLGEQRPVTWKHL